MKKVILLALACIPFTGCFETFHVSSESLDGMRLGTDTAALHYVGKDVEFTLIKNNNSKSFKSAAGVVNSGIAAWGLAKTAAEATAQRASDNALKASQAKEATNQVGLQTAVTKYAPSEGVEAVSRAGGKPFIP